MEEPEIQILPARGLPGTLVAGKPVSVTCTAPGRCSGIPPRVTWRGPFSDTARNVSAPLANGTWSHSSALHFTPTQGDHGKELVCIVTYSSAQGPFTRRTVQLLVGYPPGPLSISGTLTRKGHPVLEVSRAEGDVSLETQEGDSLNLSCEAGSRAEAILSWAKGHESLSPGQGGAGHLELLNLSRGDAGEYRCWAMNSYGWASRALHMHMQSPSGGLTWAFIEFSCKLVFVVTGFILAYYLTLLYYRWTPCCCCGSRRKDRPGARESRMPESGMQIRPFLSHQSVDKKLEFYGTEEMADETSAGGTATPSEANGPI
ncbi:sialic acid-binding Ig-like lectin 14 [Chrysemys picta bellii]|uniref:sialic acid-binding Ig-like lectin 14 n=1 Tax=Chrysemys picta bellii TaxID=8478 RepID=UPI0032B1D987